MEPYSTYEYDYRSTYDYTCVGVEEAEEPVGRFWLNVVDCNGTEERLVDCRLYSGFIDAASGCGDPRGPAAQHRRHVACRRFPVEEALETVTIPGAGLPCSALI
eukprot:jgi/Ulvmu1/8826/UM049_0006.1